MTKTLPLLRRLSHVGRMLAAFAGRPVVRWSPRPDLPALQAPEAHALGQGITLWRLPVGLVRIRERHRALPADFAEVDDKLRFPVMMSDRRMTGWLDCTAWLIDHPEGTILVDTGESAAFGTPAYFGEAAQRIGRIYPKIIDATAAAGADLATQVARTGIALDRIGLCVLTHTHSDHLGNLDALSVRTRLLVSPHEFAPAKGSGRLLAKLPRDGRLQETAPELPHAVAGTVMPLTARGDIFVMATPGHTVGHQSVVIDLGDRQIVLAGDAAFDDGQVAQGVIPGIVESRSQTLATYDLLSRMKRQKPTLTLFTHDQRNSEKLANFLSVQVQ
jgi:glyoxylase-like metal-dependent hydrolase (beta-lactamase superfamily II)